MDELDDLHADRKYYVYTTMEAKGGGWYLVKLA